MKSTTIVNVLLAASIRFCAVTVNVYEPACVGVPASVPLVLSARPGGRVPPVSANAPLGVPEPDVNTCANGAARGRGRCGSRAREARLRARRSR